MEIQHSKSVTVGQSGTLGFKLIGDFIFHCKTSLAFRQMLAQMNFKVSEEDLESLSFISYHLNPEFTPISDQRRETFVYQPEV